MHRQATRLDRSNAGSFRSGPKSGQGDELRQLFAELFGTFWLTLVAAGGPVISAASGGLVGRAAQATAPALVVMALIYTLGTVSGAHFNPAVTLAFAARRDFPWRRVPLYWLAQVVGATLAAAVLRVMFGNIGHLGATLPAGSTGLSLAMEIILTCLLVITIFGTAKSHKVVGHNAALAVAGVITMAGLVGSPISGASMNPARSFGPDLVSGAMGTIWVYIAGPFLGALLAVAFTRILAGAPTGYERQAALGSGATSHLAPSQPHARSGAHERVSHSGL